MVDCNDRPGTRIEDLADCARPMVDYRKFIATGLERSRALFIRLAPAAIIPIIFFGGWVAYVTADQNREETRAHAEGTVRPVAQRLEEQLAQETEAVRRLSLSSALTA